MAATAPVALVVLAVALTSAPAMAATAPGTWSATGSMAAARDDHTATLLTGTAAQCGSRCGKVLVAGGRTAGSPVSSAELYDPLTGTWSSTGALSGPRANHTATLLPDGRVLVAGGETATTGQQTAALNSAEIYNPATGTFTPTAPMTDLRSEHTATLLSDGRVLVAGGIASFLGTPQAIGESATLVGDSFEVFNPATSTWTSDAVNCCLERARAQHTATLLPDGKILAAGRIDPNGKTAGLYSAGSWSSTGLLAFDRANHTATLLTASCGTNCGKVLAAGGNTLATSTELYNPTGPNAGKWTATPGGLTAARTLHTATVLADGRVLAAGGSGATGALASTERFDPALGTWSADGALTTARERHTATFLSGSAAQCGDRCGKVLVAGGSGKGSAELYTPAPEVPADTIAPETTITVRPPTLTNDSTPTFEFESNEAGSTFECRVDTAAFASCTSPHTTSTLGEGEHTFEVRAKDPALNTDLSPARHTFTVDTVSPQTTITDGPEGTTSDNTPTFELGSSETGSSFACRVDTAAFASCTSPHTTGTLGEGEHTFEVKATDAAGNTDQSAATRTFIVDTSTLDSTPPVTTITGGPAAITRDSAPTFRFDSSETGSTFECRIDTADFATCRSPYEAATLADGEHTFEVRATDTSGNTDQTPPSRTFTVDTVEPETMITAGPPATTGDSTPTFEFSSDETGSSFECKLDTGSFVACTSPHTAAALADGEHTFQVRTTDAAGNLDQTPASRTFTVSTAASPPPSSPSPSSPSPSSSSPPPSSPSPPAPPPSLLPPPAGPGQAQPADTTRPLIGALSLSRTRFRVAGSGPSIATALGTRVSYALSEPASVSFRVERALSGRRVGGRCVRTTRTNRRARSCTRYPTMRGSFSDRGERGSNRFTFRGRLAGRALRPGRYRLRATARDRAGNRSSLRRSSFRIVRR